MNPVRNDRVFCFLFSNANCVHMKYSRYIRAFAFTGILLMLLAVIACERKPVKEVPAFIPAVHFDLDSIKKRGKIILLTENSATTYYLYRNQAKGYDYEMLREFAKYLGVKLEVTLMDDVDKMFELLNKGEADIIASNLTVTPEQLEMVAFSTPLYKTRQILAQRKFSRENPDSALTLVRDSTGLSQIPIWVHRYSSFYARLKEIEKQTGIPLNIQEAPGEISTDDLLRLVNDGEIPATITDENLAIIEQFDYTELDMSVPITGEQSIAWAVRNNSTQLLDELNKWLDKKKTRDKLASTYKKYFTEEKLFPGGKNYVMPPIGPGQISPYDSLFKMHAPTLGWDWQMLAAMAFQESRFNPNAQSWSGAYGLMQLMPETAQRFGCDSTPSPECSVMAGVKYLKYLQAMWKKRVPNPTERTKFVLASYNIGQGHIIDAQNLARELGMADTIWDGHVAEALLLKQQERYYTMSCVKHGYCYAKEPYHFVGKILALYQHYKSGTQLVANE